MIDLHRVTKHFAGKRQVTALEEITLTIPRGEMVSIIGPSGSGKSTLLNLVGGLDRSTSGDVRVDGQVLAGEDSLTLIRDLHDRLGSTIVIVTHDMHVAESCSRTIALRDGRVVEDIQREQRRPTARGGSPA